MAKILVVDDEEVICDLIGMCLEPEGHELIIETEGTGVIETVREVTPDLILLDIMLPGVDGYTIQNSLSEDLDLKKIPIIMMTAKSKMEEVFKTAPNVSSFISKPFSVTELIEKVNSALKSK